MKTLRLTTRVSTGLFGLGLAISPLVAQQAKNPAQKQSAEIPAAKPDAAQQTAKAAEGMVVVKDPATGILRAPTADEAAALAPSRVGTSSVLRPIPGPGNIGRGLVLDDSTMVYAVAQKTATGKLVLGEVTGPEATKAAVSTKAKEVVNEEK